MHDLDTPMTEEVTVSFNARELAVIGHALFALGLSGYPQDPEATTGSIARKFATAIAATAGLTLDEFKAQDGWTEPKTWGDVREVLRNTGVDLDGYAPDDTPIEEVVAA